MHQIVLLLTPINSYLFKFYNKYPLYRGVYSKHAVVLNTGISQSEPPITNKVTQNESDNERFDDHNLG